MMDIHFKTRAVVLILMLGAACSVKASGSTSGFIQLLLIIFVPIILVGVFIYFMVTAKKNDDEPE